MADTPRARALAMEIRAARNATGLSLNGVAEALGWSAAKVSRIETAKRGVKPDDLELLLDLFKVRGQKRKGLLKMAHELREPRWWELGPDYPRMLAGLVDSEQRARRITHVSPSLIPGLLQTRGYTREVMRVGGVEESLIEERVGVRQMRQGILTRNNPVELHSFIDEAALSRPMGGPEVMAEQLRHVRTMSTADNVVIRVLPQAVGGHVGLSGGFVMFDFGGSPPVVYLEAHLSGAFINDPEDVGYFAEAVRLLEKKAAEPESTREILESYVQQYESELE